MFEYADAHEDEREKGVSNDHHKGGTGGIVIDWPQLLQTCSHPASIVQAI